MKKHSNSGKKSEATNEAFLGCPTLLRVALSGEQCETGLNFRLGKGLRVECGEKECCAQGHGKKGSHRSHLTFDPAIIVIKYQLIVAFCRYFALKRPCASVAV